VEEALGVPMQPGGKHERMGTHNRLLRLGEDRYLEVIAVDPAAPKPGRPRWFGMDRPCVTPIFATWMARTTDIRAAPSILGQPQAMHRGDLHWQITVTADGGLPLGGAAPGLLQWQERNPAHRMTDQGCSLRKLELFHPDPQRVESVLMEIGFDGPVSVRHAPEPRLLALIATPHGVRELA
jgi:hypothetical protein